MTRAKAFIRNFLLSVNLAFVFLFLLSCLAPFINPQITWIPAFLGLGFPLLVAVHILWIVFWLIFKRRFALISGTALLLGACNISNQFSYAACQGGRYDEPSFSVMSFNVKVFDLYNWSQNSASKDAILKIIENADPDIVCLQEFYTDNENFNNLSALSLRYPYFQFHPTFTYEEVHHWGIATFSKFPIVKENAIVFSNSMHNICIASDVVIENDTIRIFNAHLQSIYFKKEQYESVKNLMDRRLEKVPFLKTFIKLREAFIKRAYQADLLKQQIDKSPYKVMVCADFNDTPNSYAYRKVSKNLTDSFQEAGCGFGLTFTTPMPFLRIDYILSDKSIQPLSSRVQWNSSSDHFAVHARFRL